MADGDNPNNGMTNKTLLCHLQVFELPSCIFEFLELFFEIVLKGWSKNFVEPDSTYIIRKFESYSDSLLVKY